MIVFIHFESLTNVNNFCISLLYLKNNHNMKEQALEAVVALIFLVLLSLRALSYFNADGFLTVTVWINTWNFNEIH